MLIVRRKWWERFTRHPRRTCLKCGFLALGDAEREVTTAIRVLVSAKESPIDMLQCSRSLWVDYDLMYAAPNVDSIVEEIQSDRRKCRGFYPYNEGWSPAEHKDLVLKARDRRRIALATVLGYLSGILSGIFSAWLRKRLGL